MILDEPVSMGFSLLQPPTVQVVEPDRVKNFRIRGRETKRVEQCNFRRVRSSQTLQGETEVVSYSLMIGHQGSSDFEVHDSIGMIATFREEKSQSILKGTRLRDDRQTSAQRGLRVTDSSRRVLQLSQPEPSLFEMTIHVQGCSQRRLGGAQVPGPIGKPGEILLGLGKIDGGEESGSVLREGGLESRSCVSRDLAYRHIGELPRRFDADRTTGIVQQRNKAANPRTRCRVLL